MQMAPLEAFQKLLDEQSHLLGPHQQVLAGVTQSLESLAQQQSKQQARLVQLVSSVKGLTSELQTLSATEPALRPAPSTQIQATTFLFPVSKPDKSDGNPNKC